MNNYIQLKLYLRLRRKTIDLFHEYVLLLDKFWQPVTAGQNRSNNKKRVLFTLFIIINFLYIDLNERLIYVIEEIYSRSLVQKVSYHLSSLINNRYYSLSWLGVFIRLSVIINRLGSVIIYPSSTILIHLPRITTLTVNQSNE